MGFRTIMMLVLFCYQHKLILPLCISAPNFWWADARDKKRPLKENLIRCFCSIFSAHLNAVRNLLVILHLSVLVFLGTEVKLCLPATWYWVLPLKGILKVTSLFLFPSNLRVSFSRKLKIKHSYKSLFFIFLTGYFQLNYYSICMA